ncbi:hypothetical protein VaNZ11_011209 [Volvox africanus]|uniref:Methyltransferase FkbM domain-containing protein n=1 Tax=Volvox africanus TaxID=51714 RepID=A0ABQ5SBM3_9CHLO|nr:hypothetical protein VaNZ11_011209 [Volvox africanus]
MSGTVPTFRSATASNSAFIILESLLMSLILLAPRCTAIRVHFPHWRVLRAATAKTVNVSIPIEELKPFARSQSGEDIRVFQNYLCGLQNGTFLELGALDGERFSNTYMFEYKLGWRGVLIEGNPRSFESLWKKRPNAVTIHSAVCSEYQIVHYTMKDQPAVDGILEFMTDSFKESWHKNWQSYTEDEAPPVPCYPFSSLISLAGVRHVDVMFLDVEGGELSVLQSVPFGNFKVDVMVIEATGREREERVRAFMADVGYKHMESWGRSEWFVRNDWQPSPCPQN